MNLQQNNGSATLHCAVCPVILNREKQLAIALNTLRLVKTPESILALKNIAVLAGLEEPALCEPAEER